MKALIVVDREQDWPHDIPGAAVASARGYLTGPAASSSGGERVINLCQLEPPQSTGYYVSLLAEARGHQPLPSARTIEDLHASPTTVPLLADIEKLVQEEQAPRLEIRSYFGVDPEGRHEAVSQRLFALLRAPLLRAVFLRDGATWTLERLRPLAPREVPDRHRAALMRAATQFISGRHSIAILHTPGEPLPPSNAAALRHFVAAAEALGMRAEIIDRHAIERLAEFDALFIRDTTFLNHYTYEFAQRAAALGLVVVDDPQSILQCNNKVYLNELFARNGIRVPKTLMVHSDNVGDIEPTLGLPCVLKEPGGGFCIGVRKAHNKAELGETTQAMLAKSALIVAQEWLPTDFDWRVTVLERRPLFVCKYFMAPGHWQVHKYEPGQHVEGRSAALAVDEAPAEVVAAALRSASLIGDGLYGVDLKQARGEVYVIEINDNPSIEAGCEDGVLKDALYREVMRFFLRRIKARREALAA
jgi:glutathione synthase/RimK-type ligase-like ATP-grasp enzyme